MLHPEHWNVEKPVDLPDIESIYNVSELFDTKNDAKLYLQSIIGTGNITSYNITDGNIQYRGNTIRPYIFINSIEFMKLDIYSGISTELSKETDIVGRIMPITHNGTIRWICIYNKNALKE
jgi:hypothetical protein